MAALGFSRFVLCVNQRLISAHMDKLKKSNRTVLDPDALRWTPLVHTNMALVDKENESVNGTHGEGKNSISDSPEGNMGNAEDTGVDILNGSHTENAKDGMILNGNAEEEDGNVFEDDDEGPIVRPRKRRRSNTLSDSSSEKPEGKLEEDGDEKSAKEGADSDPAAQSKLNRVVSGTGTVKKRMKLNDEEPREDASEDTADNSDSEDSASSSSASSSSSSSSEDSDNGEPMENNDDDTAEDTRKGSESGTSESSSEANNSPTHVYAGFGSQPSNRVPLASLADAQIGVDPNFSRLSPSFECKEANPSDNLTVDQDMNPVEDFPDTDSTALIKELSEEVFSIGATPSLGGQHSSDDEI